MHFNKAYRNILCLSLLLVGVWPFIQAQVIAPDNSTKPLGGTPIVPSAYTNSNVSYIRVWQPVKSVTNTATVPTYTALTDVRISTAYEDGFGRPLQTVERGTSPAGTDMVSPRIYDASGRERYKYMPYVATTNDGSFQSSPFSAQKLFLEGIYTGEKFFYGEQQTDNSPLARPAKNMGPGNAWVGSGKGIENKYLLNAGADNVLMWTLSAQGFPVSTQSYAAGKLTKLVTKDENGNRSVKFTDAQGHLILSKSELTANTADGHTGWLCTYYIYDQLDNLVFVISPRVIELLNGTWSVSSAQAAGLCYQYKYDDQKRMISKQLPGSGLVEMVYDSRGRQAYMRTPVLQGKGLWEVYYYDSFDRMVQTGLYTSSASRADLQQAMNGIATGAAQRYTSSKATDLDVTARDPLVIKYTAGNSVTFSDSFETGTDDEMEAYIDPAATDGTIAQTIMLNPVPPMNNVEIIMYRYYDDYSWSGAIAYDGSNNSKLQAGSNANATPVNTPSTITRGRITGTKDKVMGTDKWIVTTAYYDDRGRVIQVADNNGATGGRDVVTSLYDFSGKVLSTYHYHTNPLSTATPLTRLKTNYTYDNAGRLLSVKKQRNDDGVDKLIATYEYNSIGVLKTKRLGDDIETLDYEYNVRGWLKGINKDFSRDGGTSHYFGTELHYEYGYSNKLFNGNAAGVTWRSATDQEHRSYGFGYDGTGRMLKADFTQNNGAWTNSGLYDFTMKMGDGLAASSAYDANGNIKSLTRKGFKPGGSVAIDELSFNYTANTNKLDGVMDARNDATSTLGDFKELDGMANGDYTYDAGGNMTRDNNKRISAITYNFLNKPEVITVTGKGTITYLYDATGNKLRKTVVDNTGSTPKTTVTDYCGRFVYQDNVMQYFSHEEGRARIVGTTPTAVYDYYVKDHQGNTRMVLTEQTGTSLYTASMEMSESEKEAALFNNVEATRAAKPAGYPQDKTTSSNDYVSRLNAKDPNKRIGASLVLRVMAGDTINLGVRAFYKSLAPNKMKTADPAVDMLGALLGTFGGPAAAGGKESRDVTQAGPFNENFTGNQYQRLKDKERDVNREARPKAYLNYVLFDEKFDLVDANSGVRQVGAEADQLQTLTKDKMVAEKSGFLYVYTSNESQQDVYFDNLAVVVNPGAILEETHYYPFGLTMHGISSRAAGVAPNRLQYNGKEKQQDEFADGSGLEWYDYGARMQDPQLGRWHNIDPLAEKGFGISPYVYTFNNPFNFTDPTGMWPFGGPGDDSGGSSFEKSFSNDRNADRHYWEILANSKPEDEENKMRERMRGIRDMKGLQPMHIADWVTTPGRNKPFWDPDIKTTQEAVAKYGENSYASPQFTHSNEDGTTTYYAPDGNIYDAVGLRGVDVYSGWVNPELSRYMPYRLDGAGGHVTLERTGGTVTFGLFIDSRGIYWYASEGLSLSTAFSLGSVGFGAYGAHYNEGGAGDYTSMADGAITYSASAFGTTLFYSHSADGLNKVYGVETFGVGVGTRFGVGVDYTSTHIAPLITTDQINNRTKSVINSFRNLVD